MSYQLLYSATSRDQIRHLHPDFKSIIRKRLKALAEKPYIGKHLEKELSEYFSLRARRFRIIYKINEEDQIIEIYYVGHRRDIYELLKQNVTI
ncbi:MAG: type II toxin-antitoxin system RelE/ParE family toxin [Proteobacteria bacterium]|nr:type II toxin-antitoxin system RelE/ParE family toxin [Desulfobacteraceae bacterium]MBU4067196.1 type II toxin-antitoxin system RelE/ParE family toxin [Pseudomonadota bacterium]MBU4101757.1 type II toxin-antitoxin system RelE/ParE family toxin [Pseudomonadota bacterium]MBU4126141.1 type II toxin-antitoxin system RelE/ParE family toxin [Pseudomonadota bacterium]